jgi:hypothetical protein
MDPSHTEDAAVELVAGRWYSTEELAKLLGVEGLSS